MGNWAWATTPQPLTCWAAERHPACSRISWRTDRRACPGRCPWAAGGAVATHSRRTGTGPTHRRPWADSPLQSAGTSARREWPPRTPSIGGGWCSHQAPLGINQVMLISQKGKYKVDIRDYWFTFQFTGFKWKTFNLFGIFKKVVNLYPFIPFIQHIFNQSKVVENGLSL